MAYDDSGELPIASDPSEENIYNLGGYSFELEVQNVHEPGEPDVVSVFAICRGPDGTRQTQAVDFPAGTKITGWYVEANETEASVYAFGEFEGGEIDIGPITKPVASAAAATLVRLKETFSYQVEGGVTTQTVSGSNARQLFASTVPNAVWHGTRPEGTDDGRGTCSAFTHNGLTVYWATRSGGYAGTITKADPNLGISLDTLYSYAKQVAWSMIYEGREGESGEKLIGRFAIDLREADGGPDGDWDEPGSDGPPNKTLYVTVVGASAGMHDPLIFPTENRAIKGYGFGGDGGHGGGGGAGASTVIIYDFATSKADEVVQEAITKSPGNGSGGGKGGKGGDGCILIFY